MTFFFGIVFCIVGAGLVAGAISGAAKARARARWPKAAGKLLSSSVVEHRGTSVGTRGRSRKTVSYEPVAKYSYAVNGKSYEGKAIRIEPLSMISRSAAERLVGEFAKASELSVLHSPDDPKVAVLDPAAPGQGILSFVGLALAVAGVLVLLNAEALKTLFDF
ncbi:MAG: DUF3592 domain-containing protein [Spirochaetaceae bacterium]|nr:DUF3592 domain-containing protein [Spirochaetaceae bacterium]